MGLSRGDDTFSRLDTIPAYQTDRRTDGQTECIATLITLCVADVR